MLIKNLFIILSVVLLISGCELVEENPEFAPQVYEVMEDFAGEGDAAIEGPISGGGGEITGPNEKSLCNNLGGSCVTFISPGYYEITCTAAPGGLCAAGQMCQVPLSGCENAPQIWGCSCEGASECGDGDVEGSETCELPSTVDNSYCSQSTESCSGFKLGVRDSLGDCNGNCQCVQDIFSGYECNIATCGAQCEIGDLGGQTCLTLGFDGGNLDCDLNNCIFDTSGCFYTGQTICGDNIIQTPNDAGLDEVCDGTDLSGQTCLTLGYDGGVLDCLGDCTGFDTSGCFYNQQCEITGVSWEGFATEESRMVGVDVKVNVYGTNGCAGKEISVQIFEDDGIVGTDPVAVNPDNVVFSDLVWFDYAATYWTTEDQYDGIVGGDPEYIIYAELVEDPSINKMGESLLHVTQDLPECGGDGDGVHQCITDDATSVDVAWFATGTQACNYILGATCVDVEYENAVIGYDFNLDPIYGWGGTGGGCDAYLDVGIANPPSEAGMGYRAKCSVQSLPCDGVCEAPSPATYCSDPDCSGVVGITRTCVSGADLACSADVYGETEVYAGGANPQVLRHPTATGSCGQLRNYFADQSCVDDNTVRMRDSVTGAIKEFKCIPGRYCTTSGSVSSCIDPDARESLCTAKGYSWTGSSCYGDDCSEI